LLAAALLCTAFVVARGAAAANECEWQPLENAGALTAPRLAEASGLAASGRRSDLFWAINDSGNPPVLFALDATGRDLGSFTVAGAQNRDWEDLASFELDGRHYLLIADTGDNNSAHKRYRLYVVEEPQPGAGSRVPLAWSVAFVYPDGARDCEAVAVDSVGERVLMLSKRDSPPRIYAVPLRAPADGAPVRAQLLGTLDLHAGGTASSNPWALLYDRPTAWDVSAGWIAVLTYTRVTMYRRNPREPLLDALARPPRTLEFNGLAQAEALALSGDAVYVTGEGAGAALLSSRCVCQGCARP
jgi:hypothetical protein